MAKRARRITVHPYSRRYRLKERDLWIMEALAKMRFLKTTQLAKLFFGDSKWSANKRLRQLFDAGLIKVWMRSLSEENIYSITLKGLRVLEAEGMELQITIPRGLDGNLDHLLAINQVRIALGLGLPKVDGEIIWWLSDWDLRSHGKSRIIPDAIFKIRWGGKGEQAFVLELDNETKSPRKFLKKILGYASLRERGIYGVTDFITLVVGRDPDRTGRYRLALHHTKIGRQIWFAEEKEIEEQSALGRIWMAPDGDKKYSLRDIQGRTVAANSTEEERNP